MSEAKIPDKVKQQDSEDLNLEDVVDTITSGVQKVIDVFGNNQVPIVLISFGVVFGSSAILGRILSQQIWAAPEFFGVLGLGALIMLLGCLERLMLLRSKNGRIVMTVDAVNLLLERYPSLLQRPPAPGDPAKEPKAELSSSAGPHAA